MRENLNKIMSPKRCTESKGLWKCSGVVAAVSPQTFWYPSIGFHSKSVDGGRAVLIQSDALLDDFV